MATAIDRAVESARRGDNPRVIARMPSGWAVLGDPQVLRGYCLLLPDPVVPHLNALDGAGCAAFLHDMAVLGRAVMHVTRCVRVNYEMLGNVEPALHAHVVPRHVAEPEAMRTKSVFFYDWEKAERFDAQRDAALMRAIGAQVEATRQAAHGGGSGSGMVAAAVTVFRSQKDLAERAIAQVSDANLHAALDATINSIAVIMKHMAGNMISRWTDFLTTDGEKADRNRDEEFIDRRASRAEVMAHWDRGWAVLFGALNALGDHDVARTVYIREEPHSVTLAINRQLSHYGYHVGQIVQTARILAGDRWTTLTIPRGESEQYNQRMIAAQRDMTRAVGGGSAAAVRTV